jgi:hypothetical protein
MWFMALLLAAFVAGCGGSGSGGGADTTAPTVISTAPANAAAGVALNANITAIFSKAMNAATITTATFTLKQGATVVPGAVTYAGTTATFNPTSNLVAGLSYVATLTTGVKDLSGNALTVKKTWSFLTADTSLPSVIFTVPANAATGVALAANITATFSKAMDPLTINTTTFTLAQAGTPIPGKVTSHSSTTATFKPNAALTTGLVYTATVTTGVKDLAGNAMAAAKVWTFTASSSGVVAGTAPLDLGTAGNYAILSKAGVSTVPASLVTGNVGVSPVARVGLTGWSQTYDVTDTYATSDQVVAPGKLYAADNAVPVPANLTTAIGDMEAAYAAGNALSPAGGGLVTACPGVGIMSGLTITAGVYTCANAVTIPTSITLSGSATDVWVFRFAQTLTQASATQVNLTGGALPQNVFWVVTGAVDIGTTALMQGVILSATNINLQTLATVNGRLLAQTAVTLGQSTVTQP